MAKLLAQGFTFDVILLDLVLADGSTPAQNFKELAKTNAPILAYTAGDQPALVREAGRAGISGMIRKSSEADFLIAAIEAIGRGEEFASADWASALDADQTFVSAELSRRETEVLSLYASGETAERVAVKLFISRETVLDHIRRVRIKYAQADRPAPTKVDLFRRAVEDGFIASNHL